MARKAHGARTRLTPMLVCLGVAASTGAAAPVGLGPVAHAQTTQRPTCAPASAGLVSHAVSPGQAFALQFRYRVGSGSGALLARLVANRVTIVDAGARGVRVSAPGVRARTVSARAKRRWRAIRVVLDVEARRLSVRVGGRASAFRLAAAEPEERVDIAQGRSRPGVSGVQLFPAAERTCAPPGAARATRPFAASSVWNARLAKDAELDPRSTIFVNELRRQVSAANPWMNTYEYSTPVYTVPADQPTVRVQLDEVAQIVPRLAEAWASVPIPPEAKPARGTDQHLVIWQPATDTMWEFWQASERDDGWHARWGGRMERVSQNPGYFTDPSDWGATGTGLPLLGGLVRLEELEAGRINHALALAIPATRRAWFTWPANRTDGHVDSEDAIPEGARFRIDPRVDLKKRRMSRIVRMLAEAAQRFGIIVRDKAGAVVFFGEDPRPTGTNPYYGRGGYFENQYISNLLRAEFPWEELQALKTEQVCCWKRR